MERTAQEIVKELIEKHGLTLEDIGSKVRTTATSIYRWKSGECKPAYAVVKLLSQILNGYEGRNNNADK